MNHAMIFLAGVGRIVQALLKLPLALGWVAFLLVISPLTVMYHLGQEAHGQTGCLTHARYRTNWLEVVTGYGVMFWAATGVFWCLS